MSRKIDLVIDTVRCITNIASNRETLAVKIQMLIDNEYSSAGDDPLTDEELEADTATAYLTYDKFAQSKDFSDDLETWFTANSREMEKIANQLRGLIGK